MNALPYFKWYPADAEMDQNFRAMEDADIGFYIRCLNHAWINGGIPADPAERARVLRTRKDTADKRWLRVAKCFVPSGDANTILVNPRQEVERKLASQKSQVASESAKQRSVRSANASVRAVTRADSDSEYKEKEKEAATEGSLFDATPTDHPGMVRSTVRAAKNAAVLTEEQDGWFDEWWGIYWRHVSRKEARASFGKQVKTADTFARVMAGTNAQIPKMLAKDEEYRPHGATWLNQERWKDQATKPVQAIRPTKYFDDSYLTRVEEA